MTQSSPYRWYLALLSIIPCGGLFISFKQAQKYYAIFGALFIPFLALILIIMNSNQKYLEAQYRNTKIQNILLATIVIFFVGIFVYKVVKI